MVNNVMKKYLFLLFLLLVYFILLSFPKTNNVLSYADERTGVISVVLNYDNGINSKDLKLFFDKYDKEYYVFKMDVNNNETLVSCSDFNDCISDVYEISDNDVETNYMATGFKINKVYFIAYKEDIEPYLIEKNIVYGTK